MCLGADFTNLAKAQDVKAGRYMCLEVGGFYYLLLSGLHVRSDVHLTQGMSCMSPVMAF